MKTLETLSDRAAEILAAVAATRVRLSMVSHGSTLAQSDLLRYFDAVFSAAGLRTMLGEGLELDTVRNPFAKRIDVQITPEYLALMPVSRTFKSRGYRTGPSVN